MMKVYRVTDNKRLHCNAVRGDNGELCERPEFEVAFGSVEGHEHTVQLCQQHALALYLKLEELLKPEPVRHKCSVCAGSGIVASQRTEYSAEKCSCCDGEGWVSITPKWRP